MAQLLLRAYNSVTRLGAKRSFQSLLSIAEDALFDFRLGTDTTTRVPQSDLSVIAPEHQAEARPYFMTRARALRHAFSQSGAPRDRGFVDIGCGKGKALITAALYGFRNAKGIEFAPELVTVAQTNLRKAHRLFPPDALVKVVCADVCNYAYDADDCVFFLYNPFGAEVMRGFCQQLRNSLQKYPRPIWIIYTDPALLDVMLQELPLYEESTLTYGGFEIAILKSKPR